MSTPQSIIRILDVPLNNRYEHTFYFGSKAEQSAFFSSQVVKTFSAYTFIRKSWDLQVTATLEQAERWSYLTFRNSGTGKDYYYFITNIEYVNEWNVRLSLEIDVMQTYMFDYGLRQCFIDRQHTITDEIGSSSAYHETDEGLELGELHNAHVYHIEDIMPMSILIMSTIQLTEYVRSNYVNTYTGSNCILDRVYFGVGVYCMPNTDDGKRELDTILSKLDTDGKSEAILGIWMYPTTLISLDDAYGDGVDIRLVKGVQTDPVTLAKWENYTDSIFQGYKPRNNKLYNYPYNFLYLSNNTGGSATYKYERFTSLFDDCYRFSVYGAISPEATVKISPDYYNGIPENVEEGITLSGFPSCAWDSDVYKVWLAQNQAKQNDTMWMGGVSAGAGVAAIVAGAVTMNPGVALGGVASVYGGLTQVQSVLSQRKDMSVQPPQARGNYSTNVNVASNRQTFSAYYKCLRNGDARRIDDYFTRYGYAIQRVDIPNIHARERFTYVKTIGCLAVGDLCAEDLSKIMAIYDNGITFWADKDLFGVYGDNPALS